MAKEMIVRRVFATGTGEREAKFLIPSATAWVAEWPSERSRSRPRRAVARWLRNRARSTF